MKKITLIFASLIFAISFLSFTIFAQETQTSEWIRVHSDDGEFSIEVPAKHDYFYDKDGFLTSHNRNSYNLQEMNMLNAYHENTLLSFERYKVKKGGLEALYEMGKRFPKDIKTSSAK